MSLKALILHAHASGPNPIKCAIVLEFLNLDYEVKMWDFGDDPNKGVKGASFLKINENGRVPALEDPNTGVVSWESGACINYLRRQYDGDGKKLGPRSKGGAAPSLQDVVDYDKWECFLLTTLGPMTGQTNWYRHYNPTKNEDALNRYVEQTDRCYSVLEGQLKKTNGESILPGGVTAVDAHFEPWVRQHAFAQVPIDGYPNVKKWLEKIGGLEEVRKAYERIQKAPKPGES
ncbi:thioredoxin-like protein [Didymella exigua CBS 183.55]|uniref:Thioredoxin-like protein n=1 Tax=Didymella exigua CBS 183.55 TaxID=1150837 RepID=A0A6A5RQD5_9PLEO|nr:thioredoxin-like protein [Didymella exigua CBS 183.55]KAF1927697.1 thioredoxin-like protein [Didymella exigua CBS 183.55]